MTAKFAKFEVEHGDMDKGRSMFLTICLQRPKRIDLWLLYANSLYKMKQVIGYKLFHVVTKTKLIKVVILLFVSGVMLSF